MRETNTGPGVVVFFTPSANRESLTYFVPKAISSVSRARARRYTDIYIYIAISISLTPQAIYICIPSPLDLSNCSSLYGNGFKVAARKSKDLRSIYT